jgi:hypothetical protein
MIPFRLLRPTAWARAVVTLTAAASLNLPGCAPPQQAEAAVDVEDLPAFNATEAALFDDTITGSAFGDGLDESGAEHEMKLSERSVRADGIVPVKISTVTSDMRGDDQMYQLVLVPNGEPLCGPEQTESIPVVVSSDSPSFAFVHGADAELVGKQFIFLYRRYNVDGVATTHWRLEADSNEVRKAIAEARILEELDS